MFTENLFEELVRQMCVFPKTQNYKIFLYIAVMQFFIYSQNFPAPNKTNPPVIQTLSFKNIFLKKKLTLCPPFNLFCSLDFAQIEKAGFCIAEYCFPTNLTFVILVTQKIITKL